MKEFKGRPVITEADHPLTVYRALHASIPYANAGNVHLDPYDWVKRAQDAYGAVGDAFYGVAYDQEASNETAETVIFMSPDQLETALVCYGLEEGRTNEEVRRVDELLTSIDGLKQQLESR